MACPIPVFSEQYVLFMVESTDPWASLGPAALP